MFTVDFFAGEFAERVREFSEERDANVRVSVVTLTGERIDALRVQTLQTGARISTRDDRLVFLPFESIGYVEVAALEDHRVAAFQLYAS